MHTVTFRILFTGALGQVETPRLTMIVPEQVSKPEAAVRSMMTDVLAMVVDPDITWEFIIISG